MERSVEVLDVSALLRLPGVRAARITSPLSNTESTHEVLHLALFKAHGRTFGIDIRYVRQALRPGEITPLKMCGPVLFGHHFTANRHTPILRLLEYLNLPQDDVAAEPESGLVIGTPGNETADINTTLGFLIDSVVGAIKAPLTSLHPLTKSGMAGHDLYCGVLPASDAGTVLVLNPEAFLHRLGAADIAANAVPAEVAGAVGPTLPFVIYRVAGSMLASALENVEGVIPRPEFFALGRNGDAFLGTFQWQGRSVNLLDLSVLAGQDLSNAEASTDVLITKQADTYYGFLVEKVESLTSAAVREAPALSRPELSGVLASHGNELLGSMIQTFAGGVRSNISVLNVRQLARVVAGGFADMPTSA